MCIIDCLSTIVFILPLHLDYTKVIILILWWRNFQLEYWRTFQLVSTFVIGIPAITQSDPVPKKNGNKYVLYEKRTDNGAVCHLFQAQQANGCLEKPMVKGTLFRCGVWHMEEIKGNPKSQEAYKTSKQV